MSYTTHQFAVATAFAKPRLLFFGISVGAEAMLEPFRLRGYSVVTIAPSRQLSASLRTNLSATDVVLLDVSSRDRNVLEEITALCAAVGICSVRPRLLCFSTVHRNPEFVMAIERRGARYVRITSPSLLLEAVDLMLAEMSEIKRLGPCFHIIHRFSQGACAPGEEIGAILVASGGDVIQLRLALAQRFVLDFLAQHRRIGLDSRQIVAGLSAGWFYREHASNSGHMQPKKIRRAAVKVHVQRIREAMAHAFAEANIKLAPRDVLRSCRAEGSTLVLYRLHADVVWNHSN